MADNFEMSLEKLGLEYIDLWLMHWPMVMEDGKFTSGIPLLPDSCRRSDTGRTLAPDDSPNFVDTWKEMEKVYEDGETVACNSRNSDLYFRYYRQSQINWRLKLQHQDPRGTS